MLWPNIFYLTPDPKYPDESNEGFINSMSLILICSLLKYKYLLHKYAIDKLGS